MRLSTCSRCFPLGVICGVFLLLSGCGGASETLYPVEGKVLVDKKPLAKGTIAFHPNKAKGNESKKVPAGEIEGGSFKLFTDFKPGAPAGFYKVTIVSTDQPDSAKPLAVRSYVSKTFVDPEKTPLQAEVTTAPEPKVFQFDVSAN